ncbi:uncharacterized protein LOC134135240 [Pungitius pungitius]|uniref:uncharacterized protein LOC134135240 n=1 Tax=Pungitius pungitius TaxID=134920 RepID=UPI002E0F3E71
MFTGQTLSGETAKGRREPHGLLPVGPRRAERERGAVDSGGGPVERHGGRRAAADVLRDVRRRGLGAGFRRVPELPEAQRDDPQPHVLQHSAEIELSDENADWKLSLTEFINCLTPTYQPYERKCALEDEVLEDGAETRMECNKCVCACGNWVCTALTCNGEHRMEEDVGEGAEEEVTEEEWSSRAAELNALQEDGRHSTAAAANQIAASSSCNRTIKIIVYMFTSYRFNFYMLYFVHSG